MNFCYKIKELRERQGISQKSVAQIIGIGNTLYNKYENDYNNIPIKHLINLSNYFDISLDFVFDLTTIKQYPNSQKEITKTEAGKRLKEFRKEKKLTQVKLASLLNTTHSVIADYERGRYLISTPFLYTICKNYNVSADYLLGKIDEPKYIIK